jgi:SOS-response transcriptional repressor LexA
MKDLTKRQQEILEVAVKYEHDTGQPCRAVYLSRRLEITLEGVRHHLAALHRKGWLDRPSSPLAVRSHRQ